MDERYSALQFLMCYDHGFLYYLKATLVRYRCLAASKENFVAHTVIEEYMDVVTFLYSNFCFTKAHPYYFEHWWEEQLYCAS